MNAAAFTPTRTPTGGIQPVTPETIHILDSMKSTLSCTICHHLLNDPHSLPCQHHFCLRCIEPHLERSGTCLTCHNQFWSKDLIANTSINSMIENYLRMRDWIEQKQLRMGMSTESHSKSGHHQKREDPDMDDEDEESRKENRQPYATRRSEHTKSTTATPATTSTQKTGTTTTPSHTSRHTHTTAAISPLASKPQPNASTAFTRTSLNPTVSSLHTPPRASLRDTIAAAATTGSAPGPATNKRPPASSLDSLPKPNSAGPSSTSLGTAAGTGAVHTKHFNKQTVMKKTPSPTVPSVVALSTTVPAPAPNGTKPAKSFQELRTFLFGEEEVEEVIDDEFNTSTGPLIIDEDEVMEVSGETFGKNKPEERKKVKVNTTNSKAMPMVMNNNNKLQPTTLRRFFSKEASAQPQPQSTTKSIPPLPSPPAALAPPNVDHDGDTIMNGAAIVVGISPITLVTNGVSSLSPKLNSPSASDSPPIISRQTSEQPPSQPLQPIESSLSLPRSNYTSPSSGKDSLGSPPPLEMAPPINLYSPAPAIWGSLGHGVANVDDSGSQMEIDQPVHQQQQQPRRSLAKDLQTLQTNNPNIVDMTNVESAPPTTVTAAPPNNATVAGIHAAATANAQPRENVAAAPISRGGSQATAVSVQFSLPLGTETSVAMPSMNVHAPHSELQHQQQPTRQNSAAVVNATTAAAPVTVTEPIRNVSAATSTIVPSTAPTANDASPKDAPAPSNTANALLPAIAAAAPMPLDPLQAATLSIPTDSTHVSPPPPPSLVTTPISIAVSSLTPQERLELRDFCKRMGTVVHLGKDWTTDVTHVICKLKTAEPHQPQPQHRLTSRSLKYMHGILCGAWIVGYDWVQASIRAGRWIEETPYEMEGDASTSVSYAPRLMRERLGATISSHLSPAQPPSRLFKDLKFCVHPDLVPNMDPTPADVEKLILKGQGILIPTPTALREALNPTNVATAGATAAATSLLAQGGITRLPSSVGQTPGPIYLLLRSNAQTLYDPPSMIQLGSVVGMIPITVQWLLNSISLGRLPPVDLFRCDLTQEQKRALKEKFEEDEKRKQAEERNC